MKYILTFLIFASLANAQDTIKYQGQSINAIDHNQIKSGLWKLFDQENGIMISGQMSDDKYVSSIDYYKHGKLVVSQKDTDFIFYDQGKRIYATRQKNEFIKDDGTKLDRSFRDLFFSMSELRPMFYGGKNAFTQYIVQNIDYDRIKNHFGKVVVDVVLDNDGYVDTAEIAESDDPYLNIEAIRLVKAMPRWQPGFQAGHFVRVKYRVPLNFRRGD